MKQIWKDIHVFRIVMVFVAFAMICFLSIFLIKYYSSFNLMDLIGIGLILLFVYGLISHLIPRSTYILEKGIYIGDIPNNLYEYNLFKFRRKAAFLNWSEIQKITIINKFVKHNYLSLLKPFLVISSKEGKKYETFIANPEGFVKILKDLKKDKLLSKDSKYL